MFLRRCTQRLTNYFSSLFRTVILSLLFLVFFIFCYLLEQLFEWFGPGVLIVIHSQDLTFALFSNLIIKVVSLYEPLLNFQILDVIIDLLNWVVGRRSVVWISFEDWFVLVNIHLLTQNKILHWILTVRILHLNDALGTLALSVGRRSFHSFVWTSSGTIMRRKKLRLRPVDKSVFIFFLYWCFQLWQNDVFPFLDCRFRWKLLNEIKFWNLFAMMFFSNSLYDFLFLDGSGLLLAVDNAQGLGVFWPQIYAVVFSKSIRWLRKPIRNHIRRRSERSFKWACQRQLLSVHFLFLHLLDLGGVLYVPLADIPMHLLAHLFFKLLVLLIQILTDGQRTRSVIDVHRMVHRQVFVDSIIALDNEWLGYFRHHLLL